MVVLLLRVILAIAAGMIMTRKMKKAEQIAVLEAMNKQLQEQKLQQQAEADTAQMVKDDYCGRLVDKSKAYIIDTCDKYHYFCSWECRQKYLENIG
jgi:YHS domain-containing protein